MYNITKEIAKGETVEVMETVLFTTTTKQRIISESFLKYPTLLSFIANEIKVKVLITPSMIFGNSKDIEKVQNRLIDSAIYN